MNIVLHDRMMTLNPGYVLINEDTITFGNGICIGTFKCTTPETARSLYRTIMFCFQKDDTYGIEMDEKSGKYHLTHEIPCYHSTT